jgi:hypothetical protein
VPSADAAITTQEQQAQAGHQMHAGQHHIALRMVCLPLGNLHAVAYFAIRNLEVCLWSALVARLLHAALKSALVCEHWNLTGPWKFLDSLRLRSLLSTSTPHGDSLLYIVPARSIVHFLSVAFLRA